MKVFAKMFSSVKKILYEILLKIYVFNKTFNKSLTFKILSFDKIFINLHYNSNTYLMKTYSINVKVNDKGTGFEVTSPTGKSIKLHVGQTKGLKLEHSVLFNKLVKKSGTYEVTADDMRILLDISKRQNVLADGTKTVTFKKSGKYYNFDMKFADDKHKENYISKMMSNGFSYVGIDDAF